ncbi:hypothetical protein EDB85DRAFT_1986514, partial [Lactarius pseudohatsudake]
MVASNKVFKAFPDLEEDATFDQDPNVPRRREGNIIHRPSADSFILFYRYGSGYHAIVRMSEEQPRWLQQNMDVLVQLLQI